jgi:hypothetical protein
MVFDPSSLKKFPKFIIGDSEDRTFIVHLHYPRLVAELIVEENGDEIFDPTFIDDPVKDASALAKLMRQIGDFYVAEIEREDFSD